MRDASRRNQALPRPSHHTHTPLIYVSSLNPEREWIQVGGHDASSLFLRFLFHVDSGFVAGTGVPSVRGIILCGV